MISYKRVQISYVQRQAMGAKVSPPPLFTNGLPFFFSFNQVRLTHTVIVMWGYLTVGVSREFSACLTSSSSSGGDGGISR